LHTLLNFTPFSISPVVFGESNVTLKIVPEAADKRLKFSNSPFLSNYGVNSSLFDIQSPTPRKRIR